MRTVALNEIRAIEIEMKNKLEENKKILADNQNKVQHWSGKLGKLSIQCVRYVLCSIDCIPTPCD